MKRYIQKRYILEPRYNSVIYGGVSVDSDTVMFNWQKDNQETDIITLTDVCSGQYDDDNVRYVYAYSYTPDATKSDKSFFRDYIKGKITPDVWCDEDVEKFVDNGVLKLDSYFDLEQFGAIINIKPTSTPSIMDVLRQTIMNYASGVLNSFDLVKQAYQHVEFDEDKAREALKATGKYSESKIEDEISFTKNKFETLKKKNELFQIKRFIPAEIRAGFLNYLKFKTDEERDVYAALQGVDVLIYDDFITSGSTVKEVIRYLRAINDKNTLTVFVLVKQH